MPSLYRATPGRTGSRPQTSASSPVAQNQNSHPLFFIESYTAMRKTLISTFVVASLVTPGVAIADTYLNNLAQPQQYYADVSYSKWVASRFVTSGDAPAFDLNSLTLGNIYDSTPGGNFYVGIYSTGGTPGSETVGSLVGTLSGNSSPDSLGEYTYTASDITLQGNTSYWLVTAVSSGSATYEVGYTYDTTASGGWTIPTSRTYSWSLDQGTSWGTYGGYYPYRYEIDATPIPEPGTFLLVSLGLGVLCFARRKTNRDR